ncbi:related to yeast endoplasmic reticulum 25 kDa transmembrane protein [Serendipita indica DSM 11827]|uniref:Endoplasmic reticulum transmembrane protein n=1 Tax=Serendipita indica (strain DSM 11827) TaxID=1109443 RepID=G4T5B1_SERID|nr:related to yeast endoplasmic reticulum 25 kDa transmembrane protein [Serendipita indica DSM 11827]
MAIYYSLTFFLLAAEMVGFVFVLLPMPLAARKRLFKFLTESYIVGKIAYALKISFIFVAILFVDAVQRMIRITAEAEAAKTANAGVNHASAEVNIAARKFYAQRNTYLTGFCLFLSLCMTRTIQILVHLIRTEEELGTLKTKTASGSSKEIAVIEELKSKLRQRDQDIDRLTGEYQKLAGSSNKRLD